MALTLLFLKLKDPMGGAVSLSLARVGPTRVDGLRVARSPGLELSHLEVENSDSRVEPNTK